MPYSTNADLPEKVRYVLPSHAQDIYREAFNHAWNQYKDPSKRRDPSSSREEVCHRVAWAAVENKYKKNAEGKWVEI